MLIYGYQNLRRYGGTKFQISESSILIINPLSDADQAKLQVKILSKKNEAPRRAMGFVISRLSDLTVFGPPGVSTPDSMMP